MEGDRYYYYENANDYLSIWTIEWDTEPDALKFNEAYNEFMIHGPQADAAAGYRLRIYLDGNTTTIFHGSDPGLIDRNV